MKDTHLEDRWQQFIDETGISSQLTEKEAALMKSSFYAGATEMFATFCCQEELQTFEEFQQMIKSLGKQIEDHAMKEAEDARTVN